MPRSRLARSIVAFLVVGLPLLAAEDPPADRVRAEASVAQVEQLQARVEELEKRLASGANEFGPSPARSLGNPTNASPSPHSIDPRRIPPPPSQPHRLPPAPASDPASQELPAMHGPPKRLPLEPRDAADVVQQLSLRLRDLERELAESDRRSIATQTAVDQLIATPTLRPPDLQGALQPFEFRADAIEGQVGALEDRFSELDASQAGMESQFAEVQKQLDENSKNLGKVLDPSWIKDNIPDWVTEGFRLGMYLRTGYGVNGRGGGIEEFGVPDSLYQIVWRLGNEKDTYGELWFQQRFNQRAPDKPQVLVWTNFAFKYLGDKTNYTVEEQSDLLIRESYVHTKKVIPDHPDVAFWVGERFYDRNDIHITDLFALDMSGWGGGVEDVDLGFGKLWLAYLGGTRDQFKDFGGAGTLTEQHLDLRIKQIETFKGKTMLWLDFAWVPGGDYTDFGIVSPFATGVGDQNLSGNLQMVTYSQVRFETEAGLAIGLVDERDLLGGFNKAFVMYGFGAAADFNTYIVVGKPPGAVGDQERFFVADWFVKSVNDRIHYMVALTFDDDDVGRGYNGTYGYGFSQPRRRLYSAGVRPIFMYTETLALQFETGIDYVDEIRYTSQERDGAYCAKFTIAPTIRTVSTLGKTDPNNFPRPNFWSRPELRVFATYAWWSSSARGLVGLPAYQEQTEGWNFGVQAETWW